jgi:hypothetical protein
MWWGVGPALLCGGVPARPLGYRVGQGTFPAAGGGGGLAWA